MSETKFNSFLVRTFLLASCVDLDNDELANRIRTNERANRTMANERLTVQVLEVLTLALQ